MWFCLIVIFFTWSLPSLAIEYSTARSIPMIESQKNRILQEGGAQQLIIKDQHLWFTTPGKIWSWSIPHKTLHFQKISTSPIPTTSFHLYEDGFLATTPDNFLFIQRDPFGVFSLPEKNETLGIQMINKDLWWVRSNGASKIHTSNRSIQDKHHFDGIEPDDKFIFQTHPSLGLWLARKQQIFYMEKNGSQVRYRKIRETQHSILHLGKDQESVYAVTKDKILRFEKNGEFIQEIPIRGPQSILAASFQPNRHVYLFSSRVVEMYDLPTQSVLRYRLPIKSAKSLNNFQSEATYIAMILDRVPMLFQVEQPESKARASL